MGNRPPKSTPQQKQAYFNFIKEFRKKHCDLPPAQALLLAAKAWRNLSDEERELYAVKECSATTKSSCRARMQKRPAAKCKAKKKPVCKRKALKKKAVGCKKRPKKKLCKPRKPAFKPRPAIKPSAVKKAGGGIRSCRPKNPKKLSCPKRRRGFFGGGKKDKNGDGGGGGGGGGDDKGKACAARGDADGNNAGKQCMRPGPVMSNGFLNFMREFRQKNCGIDPKTTLKRGARAWCRLSNEEKDKYRKMGCAVTESQRRKKSKLCREN